jgi:hypothetical protein
MMQEVSEWKRYDSRSKEWVPSPPHLGTIKAVLDMKFWPHVRPVLGISEWPFMRPDGTIVQGKPTYDEESAVIFDPSADFPLVPEEPTPAQIEEAKSLLLEVVCDFPFASDAHRSAWLALFLTILARPAILGPVPLFPIDATLRGSGKTRLSDVTCQVVTGRGVTILPAPIDNEEMRKILTSVFLEGYAVCSFDNISPDVPFEYPSLDMALTAPEGWNDRLMGTQTTVHAAISTVFMATGNNMTFGQDTIRRALPIRLESSLENPERRTGFRHPLPEWAIANRARILVAGLTLLRAWHVAGRPHMGCNPWGTFEFWSTFIPPCIVHAGLPDPMGAQEELSEEGDSKKGALGIVLDLWPRLSGGNDGVTIKQAISELYEDRDKDGPPDGFDALREALEELSPPKPGFHPDVRRLGNAMRIQRKRVVRGKRMLSKTVHGMTHWLVGKL